MKIKGVQIKVFSSVLVLNLLNGNQMAESRTTDLLYVLPACSPDSMIYLCADEKFRRTYYLSQSVDHGDQEEAERTG